MATPKQTAARVILAALIEVQTAHTPAQLSEQRKAELAGIAGQSKMSTAKAEQVGGFVQKLTDPMIERFSKLAGFKEDENE